MFIKTQIVFFKTYKIQSIVNLEIFKKNDRAQNIFFSRRRGYKYKIKYFELQYKLCFLKNNRLSK